MNNKAAGCLIDLLEELDTGHNPTHAYLVLAETINNSRGLGHMIENSVLTELVGECREECRRFRALPTLDRLARTVTLVEEYVVKMKGA